MTALMVTFGVTLAASLLCAWLTTVVRARRRAKPLRLANEAETQRIRAAETYLRRYRTH